MKNKAITLTHTTPVEQWPAFLTVREASAVTRLSEQTVREWVHSGRLAKVNLPTENLLIPKGALLNHAGLHLGSGDAQELARREAAVLVARQQVARLTGDLREAEEALRLAEERQRAAVQGGGV